MTPEITIIIINKNDRGIADTLRGLMASPEVADGVAEIVVVDASQGGLSDIEQAFPSVRWIPFDGPLGRVTIPHQRNAGLAAARSDVIVFIDASCVPGSEWLAVLTAPLRNGQEAIVAGSHMSYGGPGFRDHTTLRLQGQDYLGEAPTINLAIAAEVFERIGGFDEDLEYGSDVDLTWRATDAGFRIRSVPEATVSHDWGRPGSEARRSYMYGKARARLYLKHRHRWRGLLGRDVQAVVYPGYLLALPFTLRRPWVHLALIVPVARNRHHRPLATVADHFIYGAGVLSELGHRAMRAAGE